MAFVTRQRPRNPIKPGIRYYVCFASCGGNPRKNQCFSTALRHYHPSLSFFLPPTTGHRPPTTVPFTFHPPRPLLCAFIYSYYTALCDRRCCVRTPSLYAVTGWWFKRPRYTLVVYTTQVVTVYLQSTTQWNRFKCLDPYTRPALEYACCSRISYGHRFSFSRAITHFIYRFHFWFTYKSQKHNNDINNVCCSNRIKYNFWFSYTVCVQIVSFSETKNIFQ